MSPPLALNTITPDIITINWSLQSPIAIRAWVANKTYTANGPNTVAEVLDKIIRKKADWMQILLTVNGSTIIPTPNYPPVTFPETDAGTTPMAALRIDPFDAIDATFSIHADGFDNPYPPYDTQDKYLILVEVASKLNAALQTHAGGPISLTTNNNIIVTSQPSMQNVKPGGTATFRAGVNGTATSHLQWQMYTAELWMDVPNETSSKLVVNNVTQEMLYRAKITLQSGITIFTKSASLKVQNQPSSPPA